MDWLINPVLAGKGKIIKILQQLLHQNNGNPFFKLSKYFWNYSYPAFENLTTVGGYAYARFLAVGSWISTYLCRYFSVTSLFEHTVVQCTLSCGHQVLATGVYLVRVPNFMVF